jgi:AcrR family transcriptional regulator
VSEPILYRHFGSKRDLYLAVLDASWARLRAGWEEAIAAAPPEERPGVLFHVVRELKKEGVVPSLLWIQALTEAGEDPSIRKYMRKHLREVHDYVASVIREAQGTGGVDEARDPDAEAWIFVAGGLLYSVSSRLGGLLTDDDLLAVSKARQQWLSGGERAQRS